MTEISYSKLADLLKETRANDRSGGVWLIHGEEVLVERSCEKLSRHLLGNAPLDLSLEVVEGLTENIPTLLEQINTFALLSSTKVVVFKDAKLVDSKETHQRWIAQIQQAWNKEQPDKAAKYFAALCSRLNAKTDRLPSEVDRLPALKDLSASIGFEALQSLAKRMAEKGWNSDDATDYLKILTLAIEKGFPEGHHLIVTATSRVPKNLKVYKVSNENGTIIDCNVPKGDRRADKTAQDAVLKQTLEDMLAAAGKTLSPRLFDKLVQLTGFDIRLFAQNVRKLIDFIGERREITLKDIDALVRRTKSDPIYELTNAVADRNTGKALFYLQSLINHDFHPLQLLAAIANQIRKLLVAKDFFESQYGRVWQNGMSYQLFQQQVLSAVVAYDAENNDTVARWRKGDEDLKAKKETGDLNLAANPKSPYPVFQTLMKSGNYTRDELMTAMLALNRTDLRLKSTGQDPVAVIKKTVMDICGSRT